MFYYVHVCTAQRGHGSELGCINKWSNINKSHHQLMHQRQINKMSRRQIYMLGSSALEQPFCLRVRFFYETAACSLLPLRVSNQLLSSFLFCSEINVGFHPCLNIITLPG